MGKFRKILLVLLFCLTLMGCNNKPGKIKILLPSGTPCLGLADFLYNNRENGEMTFQIVDGVDLLGNGFTTEEYDIIVAPVNLGAKMHTRNGNYQLNSVIVWGNYYLVSKEPVFSISQLQNMEVTVFGKGSTPDIVLNAIINNYLYNNITIKYVSSVSIAQSLFVVGKADFILCAEPQVSALREKTPLYTLDIQKEWNHIFNSWSYPQAGIFLQESHKDDPAIRDVLDSMKSSINKINENPVEVIVEAMELSESFRKMGSGALLKAIPNCALHYRKANECKNETVTYFNQLISCGYAEQIGGGLPDEDFYQK
jgi:NitT/TauT family transport system substrate-binding protein